MSGQKIGVILGQRALLDVALEYLKLDEPFVVVSCIFPETRYREDASHVVFLSDWVLSVFKHHDELVKAVISSIEERLPHDSFEVTFKPKSGCDARMHQIYWFHPSLEVVYLSDPVHQEFTRERVQQALEAVPISFET